MSPLRRVPLFDFDGTLVDSDTALMAPFRVLGVRPDRVPRSAFPSATRASGPA